MIKVTPTDSTGTAVTLLAQWDRGVTIYFSDDLITDAYLVHFQNTRVAEAIVMESTYEDGVLSVEVPDALLERAYPITGFIFVSESDDSGRSLLMFEIQVKQRQRPADTIYENTQEYINAKALIASLAEDVESCSTNADTATAAAESAAASAEAASTSAEAAAESAESAAASAEEVVANAESAAASASEAAASAEAAASSAASASTSATAAAASEGAAETSAAAAAVSEENAAASGANAATSASEAAASAEAAASSEASASTSATAAAASEGAAEESATAAEQSATAAAGSAEEAASSASAASTSEANAATSEANASASEQNAAVSEANAAAAEEAAATSASEAAASAESASEDAEEIKTLLDNLINLDGTVNTYRQSMRYWFLSHGAAEATAEELTALCDEWYAIIRDDWNGYVTFYQPDISAVSTGTKGGDNEDLTCTPSTDTEEGQDDYAGLPLFACTDVNWEMYTDADGNIEPLITAIDGITSNFVRTDPDILVGVMQMSGWHWWTENDETYTHGYSASRSITADNIEPLAEAVKQDGSVREWVVHAKYMAHLTDDNKLTSCSGVGTSGYISHNLIHTYTANMDDYLSGTCACDDAFLKLMVYIKYGSLTLDGLIQGCCNFKDQYYAQISEEGTTRIVISASHGLEVGMNVLLGNYVSSTDRGTIYTITGKHGAKITAIETITVTTTDEETEEETETSYAAVYIDTSNCDGADFDSDSGTFNTAANGSATKGTTYISTFHWDAGATDGVRGNDGSPVSNISGKYPGKVQGIEFMNGAYEIIGDTILSLYTDSDGVYYYEPYVCSERANQSTSITDCYTASGAAYEQPETAGWRYIRKLSMSGGVMFPTDTNGGSSTTYTRDLFYINVAATGTREWLARGSLYYGPGFAGLSSVRGLNVLSDTNWYFAARLSAAGTRGEWVG